MLVPRRLRRRRLRFPVVEADAATGARSAKISVLSAVFITLLVGDPASSYVTALHK
jgi:hypothetical protein